MVRQARLRGKRRWLKDPELPGPRGGQLPVDHQHNHDQRRGGGFVYAGYSEKALGYHQFRCKGRSRKGEPCPVGRIEWCPRRMQGLACQLCTMHEGW